MYHPKRSTFPHWRYATLSILTLGLAACNQCPADQKALSDDYKSLSIGIIGGLVATGLAFFWQRIWKRILVPWFEERIYQDARINGIWKSQFQYQDEIEEERVEIKSKGHAIRGQITVIRGKYEGKVFKFTGNFRNLILVGTYHSKSNSELDRGSFTMLLKKNGNVLEGKCALYSGKTNSIDHAEYIWKRVEKPSDQASKQPNGKA